MITVVPYVGTWIEMTITRSRTSSCLGRSLRGNVDRNNLNSITEDIDMSGRSLRGNVDRNDEDDEISEAIEEVVPYVGTWIEMYLCQNSDDEAGVVPYVGTWIEIQFGRFPRRRV